MDLCGSPVLQAAAEAQKFVKRQLVQVESSIVHHFFHLLMPSFASSSAHPLHLALNPGLSFRRYCELTLRRQFSKQKKKDRRSRMLAAILSLQLASCCRDHTLFAFMRPDRPRSSPLPALTCHCAGLKLFGNGAVIRFVTKSGREAALG